MGAATLSTFDLTQFPLYEHIARTNSSQHRDTDQKLVATVVIRERHRVANRRPSPQTSQASAARSIALSICPSRVIALRICQPERPSPLCRKCASATIINDTSVAPPIVISSSGAAYCRISLNTCGCVNHNQPTEQLRRMSCTMEPAANERFHE